MRGGVVTKTTRWSALVALLGAAVAVAAIAGTTSSRAGTDAKKPIVIGWAFDSSGAMAPFDNPALAAAKIEIAHWNARGVLGRKLKLNTCDTQGNKPDIAKACAVKLLGQHADVIFTTCDVDL